MELFLSEVHVGKCPPGTGNWTTIIRLRRNQRHVPQDDADREKSSTDAFRAKIGLDEDGDLCVNREKWIIKHCRETTLDRVGGQIWRGSCVMADYILSRESEFINTTVLELGCGVGVVGVALDKIAKCVYLTDHDQEALAICDENIDSNTNKSTTYRVRKLDWMETTDDGFNRLTLQQPWYEDTDRGSFQWRSSDLQGIKEIDVFLAADTVYDEQLTDAFFRKLRQLMCLTTRTSVCLLSLEKRYNFTIKDLEVKAPAYEHFLSFLEIDGHRDDTKSRKFFRGEKLSLDDVPVVMTL